MCVDVTSETKLQVQYLIKHMWIYIYKSNSAFIYIWEKNDYVQYEYIVLINS